RRVLFRSVLDQERQRRPERAPMPDAGEDARLLRLDGHPAAAAVAELAPLQVALDVLGEQRKARGKPVEDSHQGGAVRLASGEEAQPAHASAAFRSSGASSPSAGRCSQISSEEMAWCTSTSMPSIARSPCARAARTSGVSPRAE